LVPRELRFDVLIKVIGDKADKVIGAVSVLGVEYDAKVLKVLIGYFN